MAKSRPGTPFGHLVRHWRKARGLSQEGLAMAAKISMRHVSFIETGRSQPSREAAVAIAEALAVADTGTFLEAAGYLAPYPPIDLDAPQTRALARELSDVVAHQRDPAIINDRFGNLLRRNAAFDAVLRLFGLDARALDSGLQVLAAIRPHVRNWDAIAALYRRRLFHELVRGSAELSDELIADLYRSWEADDAPRDNPPPLLFPLELAPPSGAALRFRLLTTTLGTPQEISLRNFRMVVFIPEDDATRAILGG
jgi:transcriptional regulator with XRE-family HTH domain